MKLLFAACFAILFVSCGKTNEKKDNKPLAVRVFRVESVQNDTKRDFTFISKPFKTTDLSFRVGGPVGAFDVHPGRFYRKGEVIVAVDARDYKIRKEKAEAVFQQAEAEFRRVAALYEKNNVSGSSYEKVRSERAVAKAAFETAANELNDTRLRAPFDGFVQTVNIESFQEVKPSQPVISFIDLSRLKIEAYIPEDVAVRASSIQEVKLCFDAMPGKEFVTSVAEVSKSTMANNLSFLLTATLVNKDLPAGMSGTLSLVFQEADTVGGVLIPQSAVCNNAEKGDFVWVVDENTKKVKCVPVVLGKLKNGNRIEVVSGVVAGDLVALTGRLFLADGDVVGVVK